MSDDEVLALFRDAVAVRTDGRDDLHVTCERDGVYVRLLVRRGAHCFEHLEHPRLVGDASFPVRAARIEVDELVRRVDEAADEAERTAG